MQIINKIMLNYKKKLYFLLRIIKSINVSQYNEALTIPNF